eukprot:Blabericola_migrator_1__4231@NODE_229_length_11083_cov_77_301198_g195_i0_p14_GENE_NODE_229_length_11083_cov_77_301198_g195_i0NODE_229_length_11083_cov_77_301198_g195_i0_p14_ORF_typecomplete_len101_score12_63_NODE_229_length_11083_cov_77_301198_g195_i094649766
MMRTNRKIFQFQCDRNLASVLSAQLDKARQLEQLDRAEHFLSYLRSVLPPADYLRHWLAHGQLVKALTESKDNDQALSSSDGQPLTVRLQGDIRIFSSNE